MDQHKVKKKNALFPTSQMQKGISGIVSIYLATSSGKACIERLRGANGDDEETNKNKKKVQVAPAASKKKEEEQEIVQKLKDIRAKFGASSKEYKQALSNYNVKK